jgi:hypothetical protein
VSRMSWAGLRRVKNILSWLVSECPEVAGKGQECSELAEKNKECPGLVKIVKNVLSRAGKCHEYPELAKKCQECPEQG